MLIQLADHWVDPRKVLALGPRDGGCNLIVRVKSDGGTVLRVGTVDIVGLATQIDLAAGRRCLGEIGRWHVDLRRIVAVVAATGQHLMNRPNEHPATVRLLLDTSLQLDTHLSAEHRDAVARFVSKSQEYVKTHGAGSFCYGPDPTPLSPSEGETT